MAKTGRFDAAAFELLRTFKIRPEPGNMRKGNCIKHVATGKWYNFLRFEGAFIVAELNGKKERFTPGECVRGWDPEVDPTEFAKALTARRKKTFWKKK